MRTTRLPSRPKPIAAALVGAGLLLGLALPSAASGATRLVEPAGADAGDCTVTPCLHIQYAVNQAVANDTVQVAAGTYDTEPNNQVSVTKALTITGAGIGQTILDGNSAHGLAVSGTLNVQIPTGTGGTVSVSGLTVREPGSPSASHGSDLHDAVWVRSLSNAAIAPTYTFSNIRIEGAGPGGRDYNFRSPGSTADVELANSQLTSADFNTILLERDQGATDVHDNTITRIPGTTSSAAYFDMNYSPALSGVTGGVAEAHRFRNNVVDVGGTAGAVSFNARPTIGTGPLGGYQRVEASGNTITNISPAGGGISVTNDTTDADGSDAAIQDADVTGNSIASPGVTAIQFRGLVNGIDVTQNQIAGSFTTGVLFSAAAAGHSPGPSEVHRNRIVGATGNGLVRNAGGAVDAEDNWWGCNEGPGNPGCTSVTGGSVDFDPWLVLGVSASPTSIAVGGATSTVTADLNRNSDGANVGTAHRDGFPVAWSTDLGSIAPASSPLASGTASATLTSGPLAGTANPAATVDNETVSTPVTITDSQPPDTQIDSGPANGSNITDDTPTFTFSSPDDPAATFECSIDGGPFTACTSPFTPSLGQGPHTVAVRAVDVNGNPDPSPASRSFTVDSVPPETVIDSGPAAGSRINDTTPTFAFSSPDGTATFECSIDGSNFAPCTSPITLPALGEGPHTFSVRAIDPFGNVDPTPAARSFNVDTTPPDTSITAGLADGATTGDSSPTFEFASSEPGSAFACSVDGGAFTGCSSPFTTATLGDGAHTFSVRATDEAGNADGSPATRAFTVDTGAPDTTITGGPAASSTTNDPSPTFTFTSTEPGSSFECSVDGGAFSTCSSPRTLDLADGAHTFAVRATDTGGNTDATGASRAFTVDTTAPDTAILSGPADGSAGNPASVTFSFGASQAGSTFECRLSKAGAASAVYEACTTPKTYSGLADGIYTFDVRATDPAGNTDPSPARAVFSVGSAPAPGGGSGTGDSGGTCGKTLKGNKRRNVIVGTGASERILGKGGNDKLVGKGGTDCISGGAGNDVVKSRDGLGEVVKCGKGRDRAVADKADVLKGCEKARTR